MSFAEAELTHDAFLDGRIRLWQPRAGYRAATDPVLLAAFTPARPGERVLELGSAPAPPPSASPRRVGGLDLHGLELQPAYAELARRNAAANGLPLEVHEGDLRRMPPALRRLAFDHVLANPPFHPPSAPPAPDPGRDLAHREAAPLAAWIDAGLRRLASRRPPGPDPPRRPAWTRSSPPSPAAPAGSRSSPSPPAPAILLRACSCGRRRAATRRLPFGFP